MLEALRTHDRQRLQEYFAANLRRPRLSWGASAKDLSEAVGEGVSELSNVPTGFITGLFRKATRSPRVRYATHLWLRPTDDDHGVRELKRLQAIAGLEHLSYKEFLETLRDECLAVRGQHPKLKRWIRRQVSLIEFELADRAPWDPEATRKAFDCAMTCLAAARFLEADPGLAEELAHDACSMALAMTGVAVSKALDDSTHETAPATANLMLPIPRGRLEGPNFAPAPVGAANRRRAAELWSTMRDTERVLVVVAETAGDHLDFWVPIDEGRGEYPLPGAPLAFERLQPNAVFAADPPKLPLRPDLEPQWHAYLTDELKGNMFVSLPYAIPDPAGRLEPAGVINVNVNTDTWYRAFHRDCLRSAADQARMFGHLAYTAFMLRCAADRGRQLDPALLTSGQIGEMLKRLGETELEFDYLEPEDVEFGDIETEGRNRSNGDEKDEEDRAG